VACQVFDRYLGVCRSTHIDGIWILKVFTPQPNSLTLMLPDQRGWQR